MVILITGAASPLGNALAESLGASSAHTLRLTDRTPVETRLDFRQSGLDHDDSTLDLMKGVDTVVHSPFPQPFPQPLPGPLRGQAAGLSAASPADWIDSCTRCTYNLFKAAAEAGVRRVIYLSSLDLFLPYDENLVVNENWRPRPTTEPAVMAPYLGEFIAEEFCLEGGFDLVCLRLGHLVDHRQIGGQPYDPLWLDLGDAAGAIAAAVDAELPHFAVLHFQSVSTRSRFSTERAQQLLGFEPAVDFSEVPA